MRQVYLIVLIVLLSLGSLEAQNQPPTLQIQEVLLDEDNQRITITYDLSDEEETDIEIFLRASADGGQTYRISTEGASGDIGYPVSVGAGRQISWDYSGQIGLAGNYQLKIVADDRYQIDIAELTSQVDSNLLRQRLENIVGIRHSTANLANLDRCRDTLEQSFLQYGLETYRQNFPYAGTTGQNIIGSHYGTVEDERVIIVDGHYDTVSNAPGADDNGSAVVGVLEAARILASYRFKKSLRFIGFDLEEAGLQGSIYFTNHLSDEEQVEAVLNLEMIGYYSDQPNSQQVPAGFELLFPEATAEIIAEEYRGNFITNTATQNFSSLSNSFVSAAAEYVPGLRVINLTAPDGLIPPDLLRSDHAPFWGKGIAALMLTDGANFRNPHYHESSDTIGTLDFTFMRQVVQATIATAAELGEIQHSSEALASVQITVGEDHIHELDCNYTLSPIPAREQLQIRLGDCPVSGLAIELANLNGQIVLSERPGAEERNITLSTAHLPAGTYWLRMSDGHHFSTNKIILQ